VGQLLLEGPFRGEKITSVNPVANALSSAILQMRKVVEDNPQSRVSTVHPEDLFAFLRSKDDAQPHMPAVCPEDPIALLRSKGDAQPHMPVVRPENLFAFLLSKDSLPGRRHSTDECFTVLAASFKQEAEAVKDWKDEAPMVPCPLFRGKLVSRITCSKCQAVSDTPDDFEGLPIEIQGCGCDSVTAALTKFGEEATLDGDNQYFCKTCRAKRCATKRMLFKELPECLHLQRKRDATGHTQEHLAKPASDDPGQSNKQDISQKVGHHVAFAKTLDMRGFCVDELQAMDTEYTLAGVLCHHSNTPNSDHYTAYVRVVNSPDAETWYRRKDELVCDATLDDVQGRKDAYMLFYTRGGGSTADHKGPVIQPSVPQMQSPLAPGVGRSTTDDNGAPAVAAVARCRRQGPKPRQGPVRNGVDSLLVNATIHVRVISPTPLQDCNAAFLFLLQQR